MLLVATVRAVKMHSGKYKVVPGKPIPKELTEENIGDALASRHLLKMLREQGAIAIPSDCYPIDDETPVFHRMYWGFRGTLPETEETTKSPAEVQGSIRST